MLHSSLYANLVLELARNGCQELITLLGSRLCFAGPTKHLLTDAQAHNALRSMAHSLPAGGPYGKTPYGEALTGGPYVQTA